MNVEAIFTGIYAFYKATPHNSLYTALYVSDTRPGLYRKSVPQGAAFPFCVYGLHSGGHDQQMADTFDDVTVYFNAYSRNNIKSDRLVDKLMALFDDASITVSGASALYMLRDGEPISLDDLSDDTPIYGYAVHYDVLLET
jgi:hypothetical protein